MSEGTCTTHVSAARLRKLSVKAVEVAVEVAARSGPADEALPGCAELKAMN